MAGKHYVHGETIVQELKLARQKLGYSQSSVGEAIGVTEGLVNKWETGKRRPTLRNAEAWARSLGLELVLRKS